MSRMGRRDALEYGATIVLIVVILTMHTWLEALTGSNTPMAVVQGRSMYPLFMTGDLVVLVKRKPESIHPGDIVVYRSKMGSYIIHRVVSVCRDGDTYYYRVWGDNNPVEDTSQYDRILGSCIGVSYDRIVGVVWSPGGSAFKVPFLGLLSFNR